VQNAQPTASLFEGGPAARAAGTVFFQVPGFLAGEEAVKEIIDLEIDVFVCRHVINSL
jgi:hypothetical protein